MVKSFNLIELLPCWISKIYICESLKIRGHLFFKDPAKVYLAIKVQSEKVTWKFMMSLLVVTFVSDRTPFVFEIWDKHSHFFPQRPHVWHTHQRNSKLFPCNWELCYEIKTSKFYKRSFMVENNRQFFRWLTCVFLSFWHFRKMINRI